MARRTAHHAVAFVNKQPQRVLDVGCGTGALLEELAALLPPSVSLAGIDAAPAMVAKTAARLEGRGRVAQGFAERLPFADGDFDLVVSTLSFDHWADQGQGLGECARVLAPGGLLVLADLIGACWWPTTVAGRRGRARTTGQVACLLDAAGFGRLRWRRLYPLIKLVAAERR